MEASKKIFLTAAWRHLIMANYEIDPNMLLPYLPAHTELDFYNGKCYVSLVGFMFEDVKLKGWRIPFHRHFPEVNLRFYVKQKNTTPVKRGVVFISEIVPKYAIAWVANTLYKEKYRAVPMKRSLVIAANNIISLSYQWKWKGEWMGICADVLNEPIPMENGSAASFIFEHYSGFAKVNDTITNEYTVEHPAWNTYPVSDYSIHCNFEKQYGHSFSFLDKAIPASVFVAEGSAVVIRDKNILKG
jgi:uncharacterized protein YqjF (DUF2071 family)